MFAKAAAKQPSSLPLDKKGIKAEPDNKEPPSNFESNTSPGKENRINVKIEEEEKNDAKDEAKQNEKNIDEKVQKLDEKCRSIKTTNTKNARDNKKRENNSKKNENQAKRRKRIQVRKSSYKIDITLGSFWDIFKLWRSMLSSVLVFLCGFKI